MLDSSGTFTLDRQRARDTLQRFQLPSAHHYVLPLVSCAVRGGADSLFYYRENQQHVVDIVSLALEPETPSEVRAFLELGLTTAERDPGQRISAASWDGQKGYELTVERGQLCFHPLQQPPWPNRSNKTRVVVSPMNLWPKRLAEAICWLAGVGRGSDPVARLIKDYSSYSPIPVRVQGSQINLERQGHWKQLGVLNSPPLHLRPIASLAQKTLSRQVPFSGYLGFGAGGGGALVVVDGLLYPLQFPEAPAEFRAILWHASLKRDLSLLKLVENQELQNFRIQLSEILADVSAVVPVRRRT
ncbi:hypothetical protein JST97_29795 [bacterium]|nr:hypothetical protein [bacterium]